MASIQFSGVASGLDTAGIIKAMLDVQRQPLVRLQNRMTLMKSRKAAYTDLGTALSGLLAKAQAFTLTSAGSARTATYATSSQMTAVANSQATPGQYQVSIDRLATSTRATSIAAVGTAIDDASAAGFMSTLALPGTVTAGLVGMVVDGVVIKATIGSPATTSLADAGAAIATAIQTQLQATTDPAATVTASIVANHLEFSVTGAAGGHDLRFGVAGDTSNFLAVSGLAGVHATTLAGTSAVAGTAALGVVRTVTALDAAGLTGLASTTTGVITVNGTAVAYDTTVDSLGTILTRINNSAAGVVATVDRTTDKIIVSRKTSGAAALDIQDTSGTLAAALNLAPGTTNAQVIGQTSQVTVGIKVVTSDSNIVSNAIDGVTLTLLNVSTSQATLTVGVDATTISTAMSDLVASYNALADKLDTLTTHAVGEPVAILQGESVVNGLGLSLRSALMTIGFGFTGSIRSLADLGVSTGSVGAKPGTTTRLQLDATKLLAAIADDPTAVGRLLSAADGVIAPIAARLKQLTGSDGPIVAASNGIASESRQNALDQTRLQARIDLRSAALEAKFAALESTLSKLQGQLSQVQAQTAAYYK
jgi:flagellar hook-associated protein 2